jgi:hypothetical protein
MRLLELMDQRVPWTTKEYRWGFSFTFMITDQRYCCFMSRVDDEPDTWCFTFSTDGHVNSDKRFATLNIVPRDASKVFGTIIGIIEEFARRKDVQEIIFAGDDTNGRGAFYGKLLARYQAQISAAGFRTSKTNLKGMTGYMLTQRNPIGDAAPARVSPSSRFKRKFAPARY